MAQSSARVAVRFDWFGIAARLRGLIAVQDEARIGAVAARLGVDERSLRYSIDPGTPVPNIDVIAAVIRVYGLDPTWVLTGEYNPSTHRTALQGTTEEIAIAIGDLIAKSKTQPFHTPPRPNVAS